MDDSLYMEKALELSLQGVGRVNPNPMVGAVVVKDGKIVGSGYHREYGGPHAEVYALDEAGENARGATLYVTLEPCSHYGKTPPCAEKIIRMGIKRCVVSILDPNPKVSGNGIRMLREAGVQVDVGLHAEQARKINRVFFKYITTKIPFLFLKCAITLDGKIATRTGDSKWISNEAARAHVQYLRHKYMGILVGITTLLTDNPRLTARIENGRNPFRIVVDPHLKVDLRGHFANYEDGKSVIITSEERASDEKCKELARRNIRMLFLPGTTFKFSRILEKLGGLNLDSVLLEGGSSLISRAFAENVLDGGEIFIAPKILGDDGAIPLVRGFVKETMSDCFELPHACCNTWGDNISLEFYRN
ncbi:MAG: bifunctional diaminohydroxyphosphoribosylaminopyrimidine deaminase/5-amino-6-(5-phosphoribosylamino)uracil reductase RibD [Fusobacteriaceae bacterium]|jgi:diaminohydroxyphosphoribosylaminopyrimidine deaminase/5-amino-6-(5-phosphoribosylamino)uracil reductase|nr:bifunctional diaminohydroxyphosphoribosylaminopyrimidine deaminase/5-amino-6-(5-phosphoribosylamino)uracil reductase RibD [Fusobacteriaceae bacterium]